MSHLPSPPQQAPRRPPTTSPTMFTSSFATTNTTSRRGPVGSLLRKPSKYTPHLNDGKSTLSTPPRGVPAHAHAQTIAASSPEYESDSSISLMHAAAGGFALNTPEKDRYSRRAITPPTSRLPHPKRGRSVPPPSTITESKTTVRRAHDHSCNKPAVRNAASAASVSKSSLTPQTRGPAVDAYPTPPASANGGTKVKDVLNGVGKKKRPPLPAPALSSTKLDVYTEPDVTEASETEDAGRQRTRTETASTLDIFQKLENIVSDARRAIRISPEDPHHRRDGPLHILTDDTAVLGNVDVRRSPTTRISKQPGSVLGDKSNITMRPGMRRNGSVMTSSALEKENRPDRAAVVQPIAPAAKGLELRGRTRTCPAAVEGSKSNVDNPTVPSLSPNEAKPSVRQPTGLVVRKSRAQAPRFNLVPGTTSIAVVPTAMRVILQEVEAFQREWVQMFVDMEHESEGGKDEPLLEASGENEVGQVREGGRGRGGKYSDRFTIVAMDDEPDSDEDFGNATFTLADMPIADLASLSTNSTVMQATSASAGVSLDIEDDTEGATSATPTSFYSEDAASSTEDPEFQSHFSDSSSADSGLARVGEIVEDLSIKMKEKLTQEKCEHTGRSSDLMRKDTFRRENERRTTLRALERGPVTELETLHKRRPSTDSAIATDESGPSLEAVGKRPGFKTRYSSSRIAPPTYIPEVEPVSESEVSAIKVSDATTNATVPALTPHPAPTSNPTNPSQTDKSRKGLGFFLPSRRSINSISFPKPVSSNTNPNSNSSPAGYTRPASISSVAPSIAPLSFAHSAPMNHILEVDIPTSVEEEPAVVVPLPQAKRASRSSLLGMKITRASVSAREREVAISESTTTPHSQEQQQTQTQLHQHHRSGPGPNVDDQEREHEHEHDRQLSQPLAGPQSFMHMDASPSSPSSLKGGFRALFGKRDSKLSFSPAMTSSSASPSASPALASASRRSPALVSPAQITEGPSSTTITAAANSVANEPRANAGAGTGTGTRATSVRNGIMGAMGVRLGGGGSRAGSGALSANTGAGVGSGTDGGVGPAHHHSLSPLPLLKNLAQTEKDRERERRERAESLKTLISGPNPAPGPSPRVLSMSALGGPIPVHQRVGGGASTNGNGNTNGNTNSRGGLTGAYGGVRDGSGLGLGVVDERSDGLRVRGGSGKGIASVSSLSLSAGYASGARSTMGMGLGAKGEEMSMRERLRERRSVAVFGRRKTGSGVGISSSDVGMGLGLGVGVGSGGGGGGGGVKAGNNVRGKGGNLRGKGGRSGALTDYEYEVSESEAESSWCVDRDLSIRSGVTIQNDGRSLGGRGWSSRYGGHDGGMVGVGDVGTDVEGDGGGEGEKGMRVRRVPSARRFFTKFS